MSILADIYWAGSLLPETIMILFTQSTVVLCNYWIVLKLLCYNLPPKLHRIPWKFCEFLQVQKLPPSI